MKRLRPDEYSRACDLFAEMADWNVYLTAVLAGNSPGRIYLDDLAAPRTGFVLTVDGGFFAGADDNVAFNAALADELAATLMADDRLNPAATQLYIRLSDAAWEAALADVLGDWRWPPIVQPMRHYLLGAAPQSGPSPLTDSAIVPLDAARLKAALPPTLQAAIAIGWRDVATFLSRGFGFAALVDGQLAAWCLTNVVTERACELSVETLPAFRQRGLATAVAAATADYCRQQGFGHVGWHCAVDNKASRRVAERVGFVLERPYPRYTFRYDQAGHYAELGKHYFFAGMVEDAADALDQALALDADAPSYVYLLAARAEAKLDNGRYALELLYAAIDAGFGDGALLRTLPEFELLHGETDWAALLAQLSG